jgi:threonine/homoserine/homoserine lactone efflux protein/Flp pilus assembly protein TadD
MITYEVYVLFIASVLVMQITPGPDTLFVMSNGIYGGYRRALLCAIGFTMAGLIQIPILALGMGKIIRDSTLLYDLLCLAGALYLLYRGYGMVRNTHQAPISVGLSKEKRERADQAVWGGFVNNLLNPKVIVFMLAIIPLFVDPRGNVPLQLLILAITMKLCGLAVNSTYAVIGGTVSRLLQSRPHILYWQRTLSGAALMLLGVAVLGLNPVFGWLTPAHLIKSAAADGLKAHEENSYNAAEKRLTTALARAQAFGPQNTKLATTLNELGLLYRAQHRYMEAELALRRAATIWEQARGPERVYAATALNNLAVLYHLQRRDNEAEVLFKRALEVEKQTLGAGHPQFAASLTNLAVLHYDRGEYAKAEELYRLALSTQERALGLHHPDLLATLEDYAKVLRKLGRSAEASQIGARAKAISVEHEQ